MEALENKQENLEFDPALNRQPVQLNEDKSDMAQFSQPHHKQAALFISSFGLLSWLPGRLWRSALRLSSLINNIMYAKYVYLSSASASQI